MTRRLGGVPPRFVYQLVLFFRNLLVRLVRRLASRCAPGAILSAHPSMCAVLLDVERVVEGAGEVLEAWGVRARCARVGAADARHHE
jgi:hypothetical protein